VTLVLSYEAGDIKVLDEILALIESGFATDSQIDDTYLLRVLVDNLRTYIKHDTVNTVIYASSCRKANIISSLRPSLC